MPPGPANKATRRSSLRQLIAAPFAMLSGLLILAIAYALVAAVLKYAYGIQLPKPYGLLH